MSKKASPAVLGAFVLGGIATFVVAVALLGSGRFFRTTQPAVVYFKNSVNGLKIGGPVKFKGIEIGTVRDIRISISQLQRPAEDVRIPVIIDIDEDRVSAEGVRSFDFEDPAWIRQAVDRGLRAQLASESLVTGVRYVSLDLKPDSKPEPVADPSVKYPEIPAVPAPAEQISEEAQNLVDKISRVDFEGAVKSIADLADAARGFVGSPDLQKAVGRLDDVAESVNTSAEEVGRLSASLAPDGPIGKNLAQTSKNTERLTDPDSGLYTRLDATLTEVSEAARAFRELSNQLRRDPGSLLRGAEK